MTNILGTYHMTLICDRTYDQRTYIHLITNKLLTDIMTNILVTDLMTDILGTSDETYCEQKR